jgi:hypothetical protein
VLLAELVLWAVDLVLSLVATAVLRRPVGDTAALWSGSPATALRLLGVAWVARLAAIAVVLAQ